MARIVKRRSYRDIAERPDVLRQFAGKVVLEVEVPHGAVALAGVGGPPIVPSVSEATAKARAYWVMTRGEWPPEYTPTPDDLAYFGLDKPDSID
jgi:hypothetical protein